MSKKGKSRPILPNGERVLTLDVSSSAVGYAYGAGGVVLSYGKHIADTTDLSGKRLLKLSKWLSQVVNRLPAPPEIIIIEQPYLGRNPHTFAVLNRYVGVVEREIYRLTGVESQFMGPSEVKRKLGLPKGSHAKNKQRMVRKINETLGLSLKYVSGRTTKSKKSDDDIADAIALLLAWWLKHGIVAQNDDNNDF